MNPRRTRSRRISAKIARLLRFKTSVLLIASTMATVTTAEETQAPSYDQELARVGGELAQCLKSEGNRRVGAVDFTDLQGNANELGRLVAEELSAELVGFSTSNGFQVIDRGHLAAILQEHELSTSGLFNTETTKELGEFSGIDVLITGNVLDLESGIRMTVKALSTETASVICATRGNLPKTMTIREMLAIGIGEIGSARTPDPAPSAPAEGEEVSSPPVFEGGDLRVSLLSITKDRTGRRLHLSLEVTSIREKTLYLALDGASEAVVVDNTGTEWSLARVGGIRRLTAEQSLDWFEVGKNVSAFQPHSPQTLNLVFESEGSVGTDFSLAASFCAQERPGNSGFNIPFGISGMKTR